MDQFSLCFLSQSDVTVLREISIETFRATYADHNTEADMDLYVLQHFNEKQLLDELSSGDNFFIGLFNIDEIAGYVKMRKTAATDEHFSADAIEIERIYVRSKWHGKGLGKMLIDACKNFMKENKFSSIWLGVWENNSKAIAFYKRNGFVIVGQHEFVLGQDVQNDWLMQFISAE